VTALKRYNNPEDKRTHKKGKMINEHSMNTDQHLRSFNFHPKQSFAQHTPVHQAHRLSSKSAGILIRAPFHDRPVHTTRALRRRPSRTSIESHNTSFRDLDRFLLPGTFISPRNENQFEMWQISFRASKL